MKKILLLTTGGTIASIETERGLAPETGGEEILSYVPEAKELCQVDVLQILNLDSTNLQPEHWLKIVREIRQAYREYDGFVVTHGTDTMAYTAAALSYLIQNPEKPVIITGAQKPISAAITDARKNLLDSIRFAVKDGVHGVYIVFDGKAILGTRARKVRSKSYSAFESINYPVAAFIDDRRILQYVETEEPPKEVQFHSMVNPKVFLLKLIPGMEPEILRYIGTKYDAIIIESYGVGGIPFTIKEISWRNWNSLPETGRLWSLPRRLCWKAVMRKCTKLDLRRSTSIISYRHMI